jgi:hypothetical protein
MVLKRRIKFMSQISISDLQPAGSGLFPAGESFTDAVVDLLENELKQTLGGKKSKKSSKKSGSSSSYSYGYGCPCPCPGGGGGGGVGNN